MLSLVRNQTCRVAIKYDGFGSISLLGKFRAFCRVCVLISMSISSWQSIFPHASRRLFVAWLGEHDRLGTIYPGYSARKKSVVHSPASPNSPPLFRHRFTLPERAVASSSKFLCSGQCDQESREIKILLGFGLEETITLEDTPIGAVPFELRDEWSIASEWCNIERLRGTRVAICRDSQRYSTVAEYVVSTRMLH